MLPKSKGSMNKGEEKKGKWLGEEKRRKILSLERKNWQEKKIGRVKVVEERNCRNFYRSLLTTLFHTRERPRLGHIDVCLAALVFPGVTEPQLSRTHISVSKPQGAKTRVTRKSQLTN